MDGAVTRGVGRTSGITHAHRTGRTRGRHRALRRRRAGVAGGRGAGRTGPELRVARIRVERMARVDRRAPRRLQIPGGKIVTFGATGDTGEQIDLTRYNANGSVDSAFGVARARGRLDHARLRDHRVPEDAPAPVRRQVRRRRRRHRQHVPGHRLDPFQRPAACSTPRSAPAGARCSTSPAASPSTRRNACSPTEASSCPVTASTTGGTSDPHHVAIARFTAAGLPDVTVRNGRARSGRDRADRRRQHRHGRAHVGSNLGRRGCRTQQRQHRLRARALRWHRARSIRRSGLPGTVVTNAGFEQNWTQDLAVQSDGKLVVAGLRPRQFAGPGDAATHAVHRRRRPRLRRSTDVRATS